MHCLKRHTARKANQLLGRGGSFWEHESYDHFVGNAEEWQRIIAYVLNNPVKAGFVQDWKDWKWSYRKASIPRGT
jgi:putative transposase